MRFPRWIAYLLLALAVGTAITFASKRVARTAGRAAAISSAAAQHVNDLAACERGNGLRHSFNMRLTQSAKTRDVLISFIRSAEKAREEAYNHSHLAADLIAAKSYQADLDRELTIHYHRVPAVNCSKAFPLPADLRGVVPTKP